MAVAVAAAVVFDVADVIDEVPVDGGQPLADPLGDDVLVVGDFEQQDGFRRKLEVLEL